MPRRNLALISVLVVVAGVIGVVAVSSGSDDKRAASASAAKGFKPKDIKGKWTGTWTNNFFGSTGDIIANVKVSGEKMTPIVDFSGNVLGCPDPPQDSITLKEGNGNNKYNKDGFKVKMKSKAFGDDFVFKYNHDNGKVTASGSSPCADFGFEMSGKLTSKKFTAEVDIDSTPNSTASLEATKD